jgi:membrane-bound metal-dependent hydrolase YbcI (DUF457 family)
MIIGHAAVAFAARRAAPRAPLTLLTTAAFFADLLWPIFLLLGWETVRITPGITVMTPLDFTSYPISHSLVTLIGWGVLFGLLARAITRDRAAAWWVGALVVSHWVLDALVHRADMPLWPGGPRVGLALWNAPAVEVPLEVLMLVAGLALYVRATRARGIGGHLSLWSLVVVFSLMYAGGLLGPPPPDPHVLALVGLSGWLFVPWCLWVDRTREARAGA